MARPLREDFAGAVHHVFARGNRHQAIFLDEEDFVLYVQILAGVVLAKKWRLLAYCLMPNHIHLLVETPEPNLARGMQHLHGLYARLFNDRYDLAGHLFQGRYGSKLVRDDAQLSAVVRYIGLNAVDAGLCDHPADWDWSSFPAVAGECAPPWLDAGRLLGYFGAWNSEPLRCYCDLVTAGLPVPG